MEKKISIVIPAMNEAVSIGKLLDDINNTIEKNHFDVELIVVDDHSADKTATIAASKGAKIIQNKRARGKGNALISGFEASQGQFIIMMDADYSHKAEDLPQLVKALNEGAGLVIGSRLYGGSDEYTRIRAFGNLFLTYIFGLCFGRYLSDALNGYKAFRREVFDRFTYHSGRFEIEIELLVNALRLGFSIIEIPSHERTRVGGKLKSRVVRDGFRFLCMILY